jgi:hypothetical protein
VITGSHSSTSFPVFSQVNRENLGDRPAEGCWDIYEVIIILHYRRSIFNLTGKNIRQLSLVNPIKKAKK